MRVYITPVPSCLHSLAVLSLQPRLSFQSHSMKTNTGSALIGVLSLALSVQAAPKAKPDVDTRYPYTGPAVPVGDWVDPTVNGNGKGFPRLVEPPAVKPSSNKPKNNVNVISLSYIPGGVNIHYQTPFGLGVTPQIHYGTKKSNLKLRATGSTKTYVSPSLYNFVIWGRH